MKGWETSERTMEPMPAPARPARSRWRARARRRWDDHGWVVLVAAALVALALGLVGFSQSDPDRSFSDALYRSVQLFFVTAGAGLVDGPTPVTLDVARFLALATAATASVRAVFAIFGQRAARTWVRYLRRDHVIVCGLGQIGLRVTKAFHEAGYAVVVIEQDAMHAAVEECRSEGIVVLLGDAQDRGLLWRAGVLNARYLVCACGDDGTNARVALAASDVVRDRRSRHLTCFVHIGDEGLAGLLQEEAFASHDDSSCLIQFFNPFQSVPTALLDEFPAFAEPLAPGRPPAVIVIGTGRMGKNLIAHLARRWLSVTSDGSRLRVIPVDTDATAAVEDLRRRYPSLDRAADLVVHDIGVSSPEFDDCPFLPRITDPCDARIYICLDDDACGLNAALAVQRKLRRRDVQVVVLTTQRGGLAALAGGADALRSRLTVFDVLDRTCRPEVLVYGAFEILARAIHRDDVRHQLEAGVMEAGDPALRDWDELDSTAKERSRHQASHLGTKLAALGYDIEPWTDWDAPPVTFSAAEIERLAELEHERWRGEREAEGWAHGARFDEGRRHTPELVAWADLPDPVKDRYRAAARALPSFIARAGFAIACDPGADGA